MNTPPPAVTAQTPATNASGVSTLIPISVTFSEPVQPGTVNFTLTDESGNSVAGSVGYDPSTNTAIFTPNSSLAISTQYTATVSGAPDYFDNGLTAPVTWSFTTVATATYTIWNNARYASKPFSQRVVASRSWRQVRVGCGRIRQRYPVL